MISNTLFVPVRVHVPGGDRKLHGPRRRAMTLIPQLYPLRPSDVGRPGIRGPCVRSNFIRALVGHRDQLCPFSSSATNSLWPVLDRLPLRPARLLAPLYGSDRYSRRPPGAFTSRLSTGRSPFPLLDMTTTATGPPLLAGLSPARMTASFAAPTRSPHRHAAELTAAP
jgi:hypothetical protein